MQTSFLLCSVSKQRLEGSWVLETKLPFFSSRVASVVGNKAGHIFVTGKCTPKHSLLWQRTVGSPDMISDHFMLLPMSVISAPSQSVCVASASQF